MHIGVDLDNTVLDATTSHLKYFNIASGLELTTDDVDDFYLYRMYGWSKSERDAVYGQYGEQIHRDSEPFPMAVDVLRDLFEQHQVSIITSRPLKFREVTETWLTNHGVCFHRIVFTEDKLHECLKSSVDILIDDGPHFAEQFAREGRRIILYQQPYNVSVGTSDFIYRATNWLEVKSRIERLARQDMRGQVDQMYADIEL